MRRLAVASAVAVIAASGMLAVGASPARAFNPLNTLCGAADEVAGAVGKACKVVQHPSSLLNGGKKLLTGHPGAALSEITGSAASTASTALGLAAVVAWVTGGAKFALQETAKVLGETTDPQLRSTWFSTVYWRMAAIAALLTLPFLFAAAVQALMHSDLAMLLRAAFGYLPLAMLGVSIAAPLTMLLLSASDQMAGAVSSAAGDAGGHFLGSAGLDAGLLSIFSGSPFLVFLVGLFVAAGAIVLWLELAIREAAVYVVVLMLPLAFAALVWPARRVWAIRAVELLVALILSKFAIVAVLTLGGAALDQSGHSVTGVVAGAALVTMGAFTPWVLLRLVPLAEVASSAAGALRPGATGAARQVWSTADTTANAGTEWAETVAAAMRHGAGEESRLDPVTSESTSGAGASADGAEHPLDPDSGTRPDGAASGDASSDSDPGPDAPSDMDTAGTDAVPDETSDAGPAPAAVAGDAASYGQDAASYAEDGVAADPAVPGTDMWDQPDLSVAPLVLHPDTFRRKREAGRASGGETGAQAPAGSPEAAAGDDADPLPPAQPSEDGEL